MTQTRWTGNYLLGALILLTAILVGQRMKKQEDRLQRIEQQLHISQK